MNDFKSDVIELVKAQPVGVFGVTTYLADSLMYLGMSVKEKAEIIQEVEESEEFSIHEESRINDPSENDITLCWVKRHKIGQFVGETVVKSTVFRDERN